MKRRNFVIGLSTVAAGSAAAVGTGAFTSVTAARDVEVSVADDAAGYLGLTADGEYVTDDSDSGEVGINLGGTDADDRGNGGEAFNRQATTTVEDVVTVEHQGSGTDDSNEVAVSFDGSQSTNLDLETTGGTEVKVTLEFGTDTTSDPLTPGNSVGINATVDTDADVESPAETAEVTIRGSTDDVSGGGG